MPELSHAKAVLSQLPNQIQETKALEEELNSQIKTERKLLKEEKRVKEGM
jgi:phosphomevalonate kinase